MLKEFAESRRCRRQLLLDALGGEKAICSGCDICESKMAAREKGAAWKAPGVFDADDARLVHSFIRKNQNYYGKNQVVEFTMKKLNERDRKIFGLNVWDSSDINEILLQLEKSGSVYDAGFLWKGALAAEKNLSSPRRRHPLCLHPRPLSSLPPLLGAAARRLFCAWGAAVFSRIARQRRQSSSKE